MKTYKIIFFLTILTITTQIKLSAQIVQLHYSGSNPKIIAAVNSANALLLDPQFQSKVIAISKFENTSYSGEQIINEMKSITIIEVQEYFKKRTKTNAKTQSLIALNTAKLERTNSSIVNTLIHETIHAVDWNSNKNWDYTHRGQRAENPAVSAPYVIGEIAESMTP